MERLVAMGRIDLLLRSGVCLTTRPDYPARYPPQTAGRAGADYFPDNIQPGSTELILEKIAFFLSAPHCRNDLSSQREVFTHYLNCQAGMDWQHAQQITYVQPVKV